MTYAKLHTSLLRSSLWSQGSKEARILFVTMLAGVSDADGLVESSLPGLADMARLTIAETEAALAELMAPDPYSRTPDDDGRRVAETEGGYRIVNYPKYRDKFSREERRERDKLRKRAERDAVKNASNTGTLAARPTLSAISNNTDTDTDTDTDTEVKKTPAELFKSKPLEVLATHLDPESSAAVLRWDSYKAARDEQAGQQARAMGQVYEEMPTRFAAVIDHAIGEGWKSIAAAVRIEREAMKATPPKRSEVRKAERMLKQRAARIEGARNE